MTNEVIIKKAILKAEKNGWTSPIYTRSFQLSDIVWGAAMPAIVFRHDFAKAFWGDDPIEYTEEWNEEAYCQGGHDYHDTGLTRWQFKLQIMVLEENPLRYLEKFL